MRTLIVVKATYDDEARFWCPESADVPGLLIEDESVDALVEKLPGAILDLLKCEPDDGSDARDVPIELIAHASTRVRLGEAA